MYFVVIMAFALVLSDELPLEQVSLFGDLRLGENAVALVGTLAIALGQAPLVGLLTLWARRRSLAKLDGTELGHDEATDAFSSFQLATLFVLAGFLVLTLVFTPWATLVRVEWGLGRIPLIGDLSLLLPFFASLLTIWTVAYPLEMRLRSEAFALSCDGQDAATNCESGNAPPNDAIAALKAARKKRSRVQNSLGSHLIDKLRHQILILAAPMCIIVLAKHVIHEYLPDILPMPMSETLRGLLLNTMLGTVSIGVLAIAPMLLRYIWATERLPDGPLRDRFTRTCERIGLGYREILLWHTHGMSVNAAVMGFISPLRYILVSDALLETMNEEEIEAVFGHEAGHVRHWHLPFFGVFALLSMYVAGGAMLLLFHLGRLLHTPGAAPGLLQSNDALQLIALLTLLVMWLFGFGWLSRKFERQADLFGVRCIAADLEQCLDGCPVHGDRRTGGLCISAANLFGRTLYRIADLNGIPRDAPSWRHGSIESRCKLIERFAMEKDALKRFDRLIVWIKTVMLIAALVGTGVAVFIYYEPMMDLLRST